MKRVMFWLGLAAIASLTFAAPVFAAAPGNDSYATRTIISSVPFSETIDTTEATTDTDDGDLNAQCGAPAVDASVWYEVTATSDGGIIVDTSGSDYSVGIFVAVGNPGSFNLLACVADAVGIRTSVGETYSILIFDYQGDGGGNGGTLNISVGEIPPPPELSFTIDPVGSFNPRTGVATIHGTVTCSGGEEFGKNFIDINLTQSVGRFKFGGFGGTPFACKGGTEPWAAEVSSSEGKFAGGKATVNAFAFACGLGDCASVDISQAVTLRK